MSRSMMRLLHVEISGRAGTGSQISRSAEFLKGLNGEV